VRVARGWRDTAPPEVRAVIDLHGKAAKRGVFCVRVDGHPADAQPAGQQGTGDVVVYLFSGITEAMALALGSVAQFLAAFEREEEREQVGEVSPIWMNLDSVFFFHPTARPAPAGGDVPSFGHRLRAFIEVVNGSLVARTIDGHGTGNLCEWAVLTCSRRPETAATAE
jgi:hypothetical protein